MNIFNPSKMRDKDKAALAKTLNELSLLSLLGAVSAAAAGLILYLIDSNLIYENGWAVIALTAVIATLTAFVLGIREYRKL